VIKLDLLIGVLLFGAWIYTLIDVAQTPDDEIRNLNKGAWIVIVLFFSLAGIVGWFVFGRPERRPRAASTYERSTPTSPEYDRPGRAAALDPEKDEEFLEQVRARAEEQRRRYTEQKKREQEMKEQEKKEQEGDAAQ
jgi:Phospholipase_D-nuclease N-terminal